MSAQDTNGIVKASLRWLKKRIVFQGTLGVVPLAVTAGLMCFPAHADSTNSNEDKAHRHLHKQPDYGSSHRHWSAPSEATVRANPVHANKASITRGGAIFHGRCVVCHGAYGHGRGPMAAALNPPPVDLVVMVPRHTDGDLAWKIANGRGSMPPWKGMLSDEQIWHVVNYLRSLNHAR